MQMDTVKIVRYANGFGKSFMKSSQMIRKNNFYSSLLGATEHR